MTSFSKKDFIAPERKPYPFCPGCSHSNLFDNLNTVVNDLQLSLDKIVVVSDIGCIGIGDKHFNCHTFHGLHGRSITYATGLKLANPELTVLVLIGDGGLGIGGTHFLNAARRNIDITVIVANNFNFGMTGGQHSVTTPPHCLTSTTRHGNIENSFDVCGLASVAGCNFAARTLYLDKENLHKQLRTAIKTSGFSVVDVWELCIPYFTKNNDLNRKKLEEMRDKLGFEHGIICQKNNPDYLAKLTKLTQHKYSSLQKDIIPTKFKNQLQKKTHILIAGTAGKKIKSTATLLGYAAAASDLWVSLRNDNPVTVMSGHSVAEVILNTKPIDNFSFEIPDCALILSEDGLSKTKDRIAKMSETGVVYTFPEFQHIKTKAQIKTINVKSLPLRIPKAHQAFLLLCFFLKENSLISINSLKFALQRRQKDEILQQSLEIMKAIL